MIFSSYGLAIMPRIRFLKKKGILKSARPHDFIPTETTKVSEKTEEIVLADNDNLSLNCTDDSLNKNKTIFTDDKTNNLNDELVNDDDFLQVKRRDVFNILTGATVEVKLIFNTFLYKKKNLI